MLIHLKSLSWIPFLGVLLMSLAMHGQHAAHPADSLSIVFHSVANPLDLRPDTSEIDTSLLLFQLKDPVSNVSLFSSGNGNIGGPRRLLDDNVLNSSDVQIHSGVIDPYLLSSENLQVFRLHTPFTEAAYSMGSEKEQLFRVTHAQNLGMIDAGITYRIISAPGAYVNQKSDHANWGIYLGTSPKVKRFRSILAYTRNKIGIHENGGLADPTQFEDTIIANKQLVDVNLEQASSNWKVSELRFNSSWDVIGRKDSTGSTTFPFRLAVFYDLNRQNYHWDYSDINPDTSYYPEVLKDSSATHDTIHTIQTSHELGFSLGWSGFIDLQLRGGLRLQHLSGSVTNIPYDQWGLGPGLNALLSKGPHQLELNLRSQDAGSLFVKGKELKVIYHFSRGDSLGVDVGYRYLQNSMPLFALGWTGNHNYYARQGDFVPRQSRQVWIKARYKGLSVQPSWESLSNLYYLDENGKPSFWWGPENLYRLRVTWLMQTNRFGMYHQVLLQTSTIDRLLGLPELSGFHSIWARFPMFKSALIARAGIDLRYSSSYQAMAYRPDMAAFVIAPETEIPAYIYADPWLTMKIQHVRFFIKLEHVNSGLLGIPYYSSPGYPMPDRSFVFGLNWIFYN